MKKIVQAIVFLLAIVLLAAPVVAESNESDSVDESEATEGRDVYPFQPAVGSELIADNPLLEEETSLTYKVQPGDNLYRIALAHSVPLQSLIEWNGLSSELIHPGDVLNVSLDAPGSTTNMKKMKQAIAAAPVTKQETNATPATKKVVSTKTASAPATVPASTQTGRELTMTATAYTAYCNGCSGTTKIGINLRANPNQKVIAVDPSVIPLGSRVWVEGYGEAIAGDTGGAIKGHKIDVFIPGQNSAMAWGVKKVRVKVLN
ncbi:MULTISPECIES: 3D domain-containing protein [unclassified Sporosarcina]|uniref:3D domain-containing protein n=1 Tax=unclassified Sporosarcina TaxID=2647733 RepID=UPI000691B736|nr:3D domain-containing protein [Sporosarcina sp. ZBG7A]